jgi:hypothetical protein
MTWATTGVNHPPTQSVRDRQRSVEMREKPREQTEIEKLSDYYLAAFNERKREDELAEQAKAAAQWKRVQVERQKQERQRRRAQFEFAEQMTDQILDQHALSQSERSIVNNRVISAGDPHDLERVTVECLRVVAERMN